MTAPSAGFHTLRAGAGALDPAEPAAAGQIRGSTCPCAGARAHLPQAVVAAAPIRAAISRAFYLTTTLFLGIFHSEFWRIL